MLFLQEDIKADMEKHKASEDEAAAAFTKFTEESEAQRDTIAGAINELETTKSTKQVETAVGSRTDAKGELASIMQTIKDTEPGCDFQLINFQTRSAKRAIEK